MSNYWNPPVQVVSRPSGTPPPLHHNPSDVTIPVFFVFSKYNERNPASGMGHAFYASGEKKGSEASKLASLRNASSRNLQFGDVIEAIVVNTSNGYLNCRLLNASESGTLLFDAVVKFSLIAPPPTPRTPPWLQSDNKSFYESIRECYKRLVMMPNPPSIPGTTPPHRTAPPRPMTISSIVPHVDCGRLFQIADLSVPAALLAKQVADECKVAKRLLDSSNLFETFRLELFPVNQDPFRDLLDASSSSHWRLRFSLHTPTWFDHILRQQSDIPAFLNTVRTFVDKCKQVSFPPDQNDCSSARVNPKTEPCKYKPCTSASCTNRHPYFTCTEPRKFKDGIHPCDWFCFDELVFSDWPPADPTVTLENKTASFLLSARHETTRDILILPLNRHQSNHEMIMDVQFWTQAILFIRTLSVLSKYTSIPPSSPSSPAPSSPSSPASIFPVTTMAINFGEWETAMHKNPNALDCHAHAHFLLTPQFIGLCSSDGLKCPALAFRYSNPTNYYEKNGNELEHYRLISHEIKTLQSGLIRLEQKFDAGLAELRSSFDAGLAELKNMMTSVLAVKNSSNEKEKHRSKRKTSGDSSRLVKSKKNDEPAEQEQDDEEQVLN